MATWDVFHSDRLEVERGLSTAEVCAALESGHLVDDDLIRPAGTTTPWTRLVDMPPLVDAEPAPPPKPAPVPPPSAPVAFAESPPTHFLIDDDDDDDLEVLEAIIDDDDEPDEPVPATRAGDDRALDLDSENDLNLRDESIELPSIEVATWDDDLDDDEFDPQEEDEAAAEFTLARGSAETVEELDLAAMVDVAFQLVLFFLVTATTVMFKSLEVPKPNPESSPAAAAQGQSKSMEDLKETYIVVEIDAAGALKVDNEPTAADMSALVARLRDLRERTKRTTMLLSADFATPHKSAVLAYDAANEIGMAIAIARPKPIRGAGGAGGAP